MRRFGFTFLILAAAGHLTTAAAAEEEAAAPPPSLEYRPQRVVVPEPKTPTPAPPVTIFREAIGSFGIGTGSFDEPVDVATDSEGNFYVLDAGNNRVQKFDNFSNFKVAFGAYGTRQKEFKKPRAIAVDSSRTDFDYIFVLDTGNHRLQVFRSEKRTDTVEFVESWGSLGSRDGDFKEPRDLVLDGAGYQSGFGKHETLHDVWVLDSGNERVQKIQFDPDRPTGPKFAFLESWGKTFGTRGGKFDDLVSIGWSRDRFGYIVLFSAGCLVQHFQRDGKLANSWTAIAPESGLCAPGRLEIDNKNDYVYVLDIGNGLFERFNLEGQFLFALRGADRPFAKPLGLAVNPDRDEMLVADTENNIVQKFTLR